MILIAHADKNWGIGKDNSLMFRLPQDMKFFRTQTADSVVIMGRKTLESFPNQKPLPNRVNIVISKGEVATEGIVLVHSCEEAVQEAKKYSDKKTFVIGGAAIYKQMLEYCDTALITKVYANGEADAFIPNLDEDKNWRIFEQSEELEDNGYKIRFVTYKRIN